MIILLITGAAALVAGLVGGYLYGHREGSKDKLEELYALQEEGWLSITYMGDPDADKNPTVPHRQRPLPRSLAHGAESEKSVDELIFSDREVSRSRRDREDRRIDWAHVVKQAKTTTVQEFADAEAEDN